MSGPAKATNVISQPSPSSGSNMSDIKSEPNRTPTPKPTHRQNPTPERNTNEEISDPVNEIEIVKTPCVNMYQQKKTLAQGMMDFALLLANARQLKDALDSKGKMPHYYICLSLIAISLTLQIVVGVMLIWNSRFDVKNHHEMVRANRINNLTVCSIFVITITNVFISVFAGYDSALLS